MDYSSINHDPEDPHGASPWATSPQHSRTSFAAASDAPPPTSPLPTGGSSYSEQSEPISSLAAGDATDSSRPATAENGEAPTIEQAAPPEQQRSPNPYQHQHQQPYAPEIQQPQGQQQRGDRVRSRHPAYKLQAKVTGVERTGRKDPMIKFDVYTNLPKFRTTQYRDVRRTHSEFQKLADHLISANPEALVPALPPPITSAGAGTEEDEARVKTTMQRWLTTVCGNEVLMRDEEVMLFIQSDAGYSPVLKRKQPATGVRRKMLKQFAPPPDDTPELADARPVVKMFYLGTMDTSQKLDKVVKIRRALGLSEASLGQALSALSPQETHPGLSQAYRKLGKTVQSVGDLQAALGTAEAAAFSDALSYHSSDAFIVKETLTNRQLLLRELGQAQQSTKSKLSAADRLKASSSVRRDKVDEAITALDDARGHEQHLSQKTQQVTTNLVQERRKWFARTAADLRTSIRDYVIREIEAERRTLATLESVRPDIRAIDASGGLSRLGREAHPAQRRASLASSQGPKGDAWSGVPRRPGGVERGASGTFGVPSVKEEEEDDGGTQGGRKNATAKVEEDDDDKVDAKNAASRLATTTF